MNVNEIIKLRRNELKMNQKELAHACGVTVATISRWESGDIKSMKRQNVAALSRALGISPAVLMEWEKYDSEAAERKRLSQELADLSNHADLKHLQLVVDMLKRLEEET